MAIGRSDYNERKESRIDRLNEASAKAAHEAGDAMKRAGKIGERFYMGQPIIIGHHSEKSARNAQKKMWAATERSFELADKSAEYAAKAEVAENNDAISSDDPLAAERLQEKITKLEKEQAEMKTANAYWRKHGSMKGFPDISDESAEEIDEKMKTAYPRVQHKGPFESFLLTNNSANIRRLKQRLEKLRALDEMPAETIDFEGGRIIVDLDENRVKIEFDERQSFTMTEKLKGQGFKWSPTNQCWQRLRTKNALRAAKNIINSAE